MEITRRGIGIDFGTTNSALALALSTGSKPIPVNYLLFGRQVNTYRSILYFESARSRPARRFSHWAGPHAMEKYLQAEEKGRLIQSMKSFLASSLFTSTNIFGRNYAIEDLVSVLMRSLVEDSESQTGNLDGTIVVGIPVKFVGAENTADQDLARTRLKRAFENAGIDNIKFEYEPVAAAYAYENRLNHEELVLIADFGGGTSDFSVLQLGPATRRHHSQRQVLATKGVPIAGDAFDARIVKHLVSPLLGYGSTYRSLGKKLVVPAGLYTKLERWHHLSFLKSKETMDLLRSLRAYSDDPRRIDAFISLINDDLGYQLHQAVQQTKYQLSSDEVASFQFRHPGIHIEKQVTRGEFEEWISPELNQIEAGLDEVVTAIGNARQIDRVFLTGGSSFVPAVRQIFEKRFGSSRLAGGDEFTSVATGLSLRALEISV